MENSWDMLEMDVLKQIGTTAADYGSVALCELLGRDIRLSLPTITPLEVKEFLSQLGPTGGMLSVQCDIIAGLEGRLLLTFEEEGAVRFVHLCYPQYEVQKEGSFTDMGLSALKEVGNVVMCAYIKALSRFLNSVVIPSPPTIARGSLEEIIDKARVTSGKIYILLIDTVFERKQERIEGRMEFMLTRSDKDLIQASCRGSSDN